MENGDHGDLIAHVQELVEVESRVPPGCVIDQSMAFYCVSHFLLCFNVFYIYIMKILKNYGLAQKIEVDCANQFGAPITNAFFSRVFGKRYIYRL